MASMLSYLNPWSYYGSSESASTQAASTIAEDKGEKTVPQCEPCIVIKSSEEAKPVEETSLEQPQVTPVTVQVSLVNDGASATVTTSVSVPIQCGNPQAVEGDLAFSLLNPWTWFPSGRGLPEGKTEKDLLNVLEKAHLANDANVPTAPLLTSVSTKAGSNVDSAPPVITVTSETLQAQQAVLFHTQIVPFVPRPEDHPMYSIVKAANEIREHHKVLNVAKYRLPPNRKQFSVYKLIEGGIDYNDAKSY